MEKDVCFPFRFIQKIKIYSNLFFFFSVYFADLCSKSANYCHTSKEQPIGILLLAEVALGNMYVKHEAEMITQLKSPYNSTKGEGQYTPDPSTFETL